MDAERWARIETVFHAASDQPPERRERFLEEACAGDEDLRIQVARLLREHDEDPGFLEEPIARVGDLSATEGEERYIGPYRLNRLIGRGGMGEVYLATQEGDDFRRSVAVKVSRRGMDTEGVLRRFRLERRILASLQHPNIARLLDGGATDDGRPYVVMEYVDGVPLDRYADQNMLDVRARIDLFLLVCDAVQHAHQNLVVHRDLKPTNILVTRAGVPKLLDFGISKVMDPEAFGEGATVAGTRVLTPEYASPEQLLGKMVTAASDVFALGILLFEILTGHHPTAPPGFSMESLARAAADESEVSRPSTVVLQVRTRSRGPETETITPESVGMRRGIEPRRLRRLLQGDLDNIVMKALRKDPERRYATVSGLADDLRRYLDGEPVRARADTFSYRAGKFIRKHRVSLGAAAAVFLSLVGATAYSVRQSRLVAVERDQALEVESFLLEMFGSAAPDAQAGDPVTARQLLDRQVEALEGYASDAELQARMTRVLAEAYDRLGLYSEAAELAGRALELRRSIHPPGHPEIAKSLGLMGWILHEAGDSERGEELLAEALPYFRAVDEPGGLSRALNDLGVIREAAGDYAGADSLYEEALELRRGGTAAGVRAWAITASNLSVVRYRQADYPAAVAMAEEALGAMREALGADHQRSVIIQSNLAAMRQAMGDAKGAAAEYEDLIERQTRLQGGDHPVTLRLVSALGASLYRLGRYDRAEAMFRRAVEGQRVNLGDDHADVAQLRSRLAQVLTRQGRPDEAVAILEESVGVLRARYGSTHQRVAEALESLADAVGGAGDPRRAEALQREALASIDGALGRDHPSSALVRARLADRIRAQDGRAGEALALYAEAHRVFQGALAPDHQDVLRSRIRMAHMNLLLGRFDVVDSLLDEESLASPGGEHGGYAALFDSLVVRRRERSGEG